MNKAGIISISCPVCGSISVIPLSKVFPKHPMAENMFWCNRCQNIFSKDQVSRLILAKINILPASSDMISVRIQKKIATSKSELLVQ